MLPILSFFCFVYLAYSGSVVCPKTGQPSVSCDVDTQCLSHCCLTSGLCPSSSCVSSFDAPNDARANCVNQCQAQVACIPVVPTCRPHNRLQHCIGTISCLTADCDGRAAGDICLYDGVSVNFKICDGFTLPEDPYCETQVQFLADNYYLSLADLKTHVIGSVGGGILVTECGTPLDPLTASEGKVFGCFSVEANPDNTPVQWERVPTATATIVSLVSAYSGVDPTSVISKVVDCNVA